MSIESANQSAAANRRPAGQSGGLDNLAAIVAATGRFRRRSLSLIVRRLHDFMNESHTLTEKLRVVSLSPEGMTVRVVRTESETAPEDWTFPATRLPEEWLDWEAGKEFELMISERELEWLQGKRDLDE